MSGRQRNMAIRTDINKQGWETSDFPVACDKCYGANPYMRMLKQNYGQQCRICFRPFTVFKWKGNLGIYKRTCICQFCSKQKNLCQVCTLDLQFGLPMQIRDKRCGVNGKYLLDSNMESIQSVKVKPPLPPGPPPGLDKQAKPENTELVFIPEKDSEQQDLQQNQNQKPQKQPAEQPQKGEQKQNQTDLVSDAKVEQKEQASELSNKVKEQTKGKNKKRTKKGK